MLSFRTNIIPSDELRIIQMTQTTGFFSPNEIQIVGDLIQEHLTKGAERSGYFFIIAEMDHQLVGYTCYGPISGIASRHSLYWIVVDPTYQKQKIGTQLLLKTEKLIQNSGGKRIYLETSGAAMYMPTRAFYSKNQYIVAATLPGYFDELTDKVIYQKDLSDQS